MGEDSGKLGYLEFERLGRRTGRPCRHWGTPDEEEGGEREGPGRVSRPQAGEEGCMVIWQNPQGRGGFLARELGNGA